ncbi:MAG: hypothetical protein NW207_04345 [Cytophagales bacterium]|nr:hypothetical protein [Cytophagales bacterium]
MKNVIYLLLFLSTFRLVAQQDNKDKIASAKIAFLSDKIDLTPEQSTVFWPLYNEFQDKKYAIRAAIKTLKTESGSLSVTDEQLQTDFNKYLDLKTKETELEREYYKKFTQILKIRQVIALIKAEKDFTLMLLKKISN